MPAGIADDRLLGGVDLGATLKTGRPVLQKGILAEADGGVVIAASAERMGTGTAARIAAVLDRGEVETQREGLAACHATRFALVLLDEGAGPQEGSPALLAERMAFRLELAGLALCDLVPAADEDRRIGAARTRLMSFGDASEGVLAALVRIAARLGIHEMRASLFALRAARAAAAWEGRSEIGDGDLTLAARLVFAPRATQMPDEPQDEEPPRDEAPPPPPPENETRPLDDVILEAVAAVLPERLLAEAAARALAKAKGPARSGSGEERKAPLRGRPAGVRAGTLRAGERLALVDTLRAAAPWQRVRKRAPGKPVSVRRDDVRVKRFVERQETTVVFCVDASGSTAFQRLAEAKGAVELLLAEAYVARTQVALVVFRGPGAELVLPPTRSLTRAKALLAALPGGGGTPLATGLDAACDVAEAERRKGRTAVAVVLTDGKANLARDGTPSRERAQSEALEAARRFAVARISSIVIDASPRPRDEARALSETMGARYVALPRLDSGEMRGLAQTLARDAG
jgi:magnesium chelatase subunit D